MDNQELDTELTEVEVITLTDSNGEDFDYELLDEIEYNDAVYIVVTPFIEDTNEDDPVEIQILELKPIDEENCDCVGIADKALFDTLYDMFRERKKDIFPFED